MTDRRTDSVPRELFDALEAAMQDELKVQIRALKRPFKTDDDLDEIASLLAVRVVDQFIVAAERTPDTPRFR